MTFPRRLRSVFRLRPFLFSALCLLAPTAVRAVNPIIPEGRFLSDPAPRVGPDGRLWVFGSRDVRRGDWCSKFNDVLETRDMRTFRLHENILDAGRTLYAPDAIFLDGLWRLFYCTPERDHAEGVAMSPSPTGPFTGARKLEGCTQIDPSVFRDDDGTVYFFWGQYALKGGVLDRTLDRLAEGSVRESVITEKTHHFHEGVQLLKRNGIYYLVYADTSRRGRPTSIGYSTAKSPFGPYVYRGVIIDNFGCDPESWNNHGGIVEYGGRWYVFYHRSTNASSVFRKACVEPIAFDADGLIAEVEMTSNGAEPPLDAFGWIDGRLACLLTGSVRVQTGADGRERLARAKNGDTALWRYLRVDRPARSLVLKSVPRDGGTVRVRDEKGALLGEARVGPGDGERETEIPLAGLGTGARKAIRLEFAGGAGGALPEVVAWRLVPGGEGASRRGSDGQ